MDLRGEHPGALVAEAGGLQGFMARVMGYLQCWSHLRWRHFPPYCQVIDHTLSNFRMRHQFQRGWQLSLLTSCGARDRRELQEELGLTLPADAFEFLFVYLQEW